MQFSRFYENLSSDKVPFFHLFSLLASLIIVNYIGIFGPFSPGGTYVLILVFASILFYVGPLYAFIFTFAVHVDIMGCFSVTTTGSKALTLVCMYAIIYFGPGSIIDLFNDKKIKILFHLGLIFGLYVIVFNIGLKSGLTSVNFTQSFGYTFGFLTILPAYYFTLNKPRDFLSIVAVAGLFVFAYYFSLLSGLNLFRLTGGDRGIGSNIDRMAGYDVRQFCIFFAYLIPAVFMSSDLKKIEKLILMGIGLLSYVVLVLAFYRLAMFYVLSGMIISIVYIRHYSSAGNLIRMFFLILIFFLIANFFFGEYLKELNNIFSATFDYFTGKGQDTSADTRAEYQVPIMTKIISDNWWTGAGLIEMRKMMAFEMFGFVDIPILGTLSAFGIIGMFVYYLRYFFLLGGSKIDTYRTNLYFDNHSPFTFFLYLTLKAYLITMVTFRMFYISWELTFDYLQAEFGLMAGVFLALNYFFRNYEGEDEHL